MIKTLFFKKLSSFTVFLACLILIIQNFQDKLVLGNLIWASLLYYYLLSLSTGLITISGMKKNNKTFITRTYSSIGIRFIFSIFPLAIYLFFSATQEIPLIVAYLLLYFLYTSFEIYFLVITLRPDSKK